MINLSSSQKTEGLESSKNDDVQYHEKDLKLRAVSSEPMLLKLLSLSTQTGGSPEGIAILNNAERSASADEYDLESFSLTASSNSSPDLTIKLKDFATMRILGLPQ